MKKQYSSDLKMKAVKYYLKIKNYTKTCKIFECSVRSLKRWVEKYNKTGDVKRKKRNELSYKITKEHIKFIKEIVKKDPDIFMEMVSLFRFAREYKIYAKNKNIYNKKNIYR
jgi:transposase